MRLARVVTAFDSYDPDIDHLVDAGDLSVLQLEYQRPRVPESIDLAWQNSAPGFFKQLRSLHKSLYLQPQLNVVTNAGGGDTLGCVERLADFLCDHDNAKLPITALRGDNVFSQLEELTAAGHELRDMASGTPLHELTRPLLAAQIELGAGPFATAWDEGSRFVVAGCFDGAAPFIAAAVSTYGWSWEQLDRIAPVATAASFSGMIAEIDKHGSVHLDSSRIDPTGCRVAAQMKEATAVSDEFRHADVHCHVANLSISRESDQIARLKGVVGVAPSGRWRIRLTYDAGYYAEALLRSTNVSTENTDKELLDLLFDESATGQPVSLDILRSTQQPAATFVRATCQTQDRKVCEHFVRQVNNVSVRSNFSDYQLVGVQPQVLRYTEPIWCQIPREAIAVSVDTRPANEWR